MLGLRGEKAPRRPISWGTGKRGTGTFVRDSLRNSCAGRCQKKTRKRRKTATEIGCERALLSPLEAATVQRNISAESPEEFSTTTARERKISGRSAASRATSQRALAERTVRMFEASMVSDGNNRESSQPQGVVFSFVLRNRTHNGYLPHESNGTDSIGSPETGFWGTVVTTDPAARTGTGARQP